MREKLSKEQLKVIKKILIRLLDKVVLPTVVVVVTKVVGNDNNNKPQCQLCGKFEHIVHNCYHKFDITFQIQNCDTPKIHVINFIKLNNYLRK